MTKKTGYRNFQLFKWLGWVLLFIVLWFRGCNNSENPNVSKPVTGSFKPVKPNNTNLGSIDTILLPKFVKSKPIIEYKNNEVNKELAIENYNLQMAYTNATDSIERLKMYINAIQLKSFNKTFEDDYLSATLKGISQGEVKEIGLDYKIKPQPIPITKFRLLAGLNVSNTLLFDKPIFNANLGFQNAKGNIIEVGFDSEKRINIGFKKSIFKIVK
jgi:hypothetical protein